MKWIHSSTMHIGYDSDTSCAASVCSDWIRTFKQIKWEVVNSVAYRINSWFTHLDKTSQINLQLKSYRIMKYSSLPTDAHRMSCCSITFLANKSNHMHISYVFVAFYVSRFCPNFSFPSFYYRKFSLFIIFFANNQKKPTEKLIQMKNPLKQTIKSINWCSKINASCRIYSNFANDFMNVQNKTQCTLRWTRQWDEILPYRNCLTYFNGLLMNEKTVFIDT